MPSAVQGHSVASHFANDIMPQAAAHVFLKIRVEGNRTRCNSSNRECATYVQQNRADLQAIISAWESLSKEVKARIVKLVHEDVADRDRADFNPLVVGSIPTGLTNISSFL